ncbi:MAG: RNA polymerase sigma factor [Actinocrinis sp.]
MNADYASGAGRATAATAGGAPVLLDPVPDAVDLLDRPLRTEPIRPSGDAGDGWGRAAAYDAYVDGLHTYAIWSLRDHDAAVDALYCAFVIADRNVTQLQQPEHIQPWLYAILRRECMLRAASVPSTSLVFSPAASSTSLSLSTSSASDTVAMGVAVDGASSLTPASVRLRPPSGAADPSGSLASLERNLRRAEFHSLEWPESEGLAPAHREILELTIRHGLDSNGLGLVLGLGQSGGRAGSGAVIGSVGSQGFGVLADAWRELERSLAAVAVAKASREHCAQLAELTFGWTGRLNATLRAPLTEHVDGCTRCQHYLHTVIGTPAAPTILPFVAAPRALREIVLDELHDPDNALRLGIDHEAIAARIQRFAPDGFPSVGEPVPVRRRGGRRAVPKRGSSRVVTTAPGAKATTATMGGAASAAASAAAVTLPAWSSVVDNPAVNSPAVDAATDVHLPRRTRGASGLGAETRTRHVSSSPSPTSAMPSRARDRSSDDTVGVYRTPGSWAARVLPPDAEMERMPTTGVSRSARAQRPRATDGVSNAGPRAGAPVTGGAAAGAAFSKGIEPPTEFISTGPGRFALRASESPVLGAEPDAAQPSGAHSATRTQRFAAPSTEQPRGVDGGPRSHPRHKSRPVRQAMLSAVALGAVGAAAAAAAALIGVASNGHGSSNLLDGSAPSGPIGSQGGSGMSVSVSTPPAPVTSSNAQSSAARGHGIGAGGGGAPAGSASGVGAASSGAAGAGQGGAGAGSGGPGVNTTGFHVSINQRAADPNSVSILLRNSGGTPIAWSATRHDAWIVLSQNSGTLAAGQSITITATATSAAPAGQWTTTVTFAPNGAVVTLRGGYPVTSTPPPSQQPTGGTGGTGGSTPSSPGSSGPPSDGSSQTPTPGASSSPPSGGSPSRTMPSDGGGSSNPSGGGAGGTGASTAPGTGA